MQQVSPEIALVVEAECFRLHEGSMSIAVSARRCRSTGVEDCIMLERPASEPRRSDGVVIVGGGARGRTGARRRAEVGLISGKRFAFVLIAHRGVVQGGLQRSAAAAVNSQGLRQTAAISHGHRTGNKDFREGWDVEASRLRGEGDS